MPRPQPIAIVAMAGVFPGATDTHAFWDHIVDRKQAFAHVPPERWPVPPQAMIDPAGGPDKAFHDRCGLIRDFTPDLSGLDPELAACLDPVCRLAVHTSGQAIRACHLKPEHFERVAVILAAIALPTEGASRFSWQVFGPAIGQHLGWNLARNGTGPTPATAVGAGVVGLPAALVARIMGFGGGSFTLDAACASSLYAIKLACDRLAADQADAVVVGGVSRPDCLYTQTGFTQLKALSPSGRCAPFDRAADGLLVGEGAAVFVLKRLGDALDHGDRILGVITGIGLSNDIGGGLLAPHSEGQVRAMAQAYRLAGWRPDQVDLIECHGAGTPVGDAVEIESLKTLWKDLDAPTGACPIGSVKSNIGHLLTAAGAASLAKILLAFAHESLPPQAGFDQPIDNLAASPFSVQTLVAAWPRRRRTPLRAAISAFGFGGINAHLLVEAYRPAGVSIGVPALPAAQPIAVVGMGACFGPAADVQAVTASLIGNRCLIGSLPKRRWRGVAAPVQVPGAYIDELIIDASPLRIPPSEMPDMLCQQLLMLKVALEAMADAGLDDRSAKPWMGAVVAIDFDFASTDFHLRWLAGQAARQNGTSNAPDKPQPNEWIENVPNQCSPPLTAARVLGALGSIAASRVARQFGLGGPAFTLSDGPAGGMRALETAVRLIQTGQVRAVLAGAVGMAGDLRQILTENVIGSLEAMAPVGAAFKDIGPAGDGAAALVLKPLSEAIENNDRIYAVIKGVGSAGGTPAAACGRSLQAALQDASDGPGRAVHLLSSCPDRPAAPLVLPPWLADAVPQRIEALIGNCGAATSLAAALAVMAKVGQTPKAWGLARVLGYGGSTAHLVVANSGGAPWFNANRKTESPRSVRPYRRHTGHLLIGSAAPGVAAAGGTLPAPDFPDPENRSPAATVEPSGGLDMLSLAAASSEAAARAHETFLDLAAGLTRQYADTLGRRIDLLQARQSLPPGPPAAIAPTAAMTAPDGGQRPPNNTPAPGDIPVFSRSDCLEFAVGSAAAVLGPEFAAVDTYPARVRLPDEPLMLVDRIVAISGTKGVLGPGTIVTEHDVVDGAWYLDGGRAPACIAIEAGQADLFLSAYLGIDKVVQGLRTYRLLDATVRFHRGLPRPGETVRYAIQIEKFVRQGDTHLFFFNFQGTISGVPLITMQAGCAGFFTAEEVKRSGGIIATDQDTHPQPGKVTGDYAPLLPPGLPRSLDDNAVEALARGDLEGCFGKLFQGLTLPATLRLPRGRMGLIHRVLEINPAGGRFGLGLIRGQADIHPDDWFLTCHFIDDRVMPGTLMYQCCEHTLRIFLFSLGWIGDCADACFEPVAGVQSRLKCRGPVTPATAEVVYDVHVKEIGYGPEPYAVADAHMHADGRHIVFFENLSLKITGLTRASIQKCWAGKIPRTAATPLPEQRPAVFSRDKVLAFAAGLPSQAFGDPYRPFDGGRFIARLPGPPYSFIDRIQSAEPAAWKLAPGGWIEAVYPVPSDAWYFRADRSGAMPFCVLQEAALQACGWLAAYMGSALKSAKDLYFRNLGGTAIFHQMVFPGSEDLHTRARLTKVSGAGDMIIQHYEFETVCGGKPVYSGSTHFGFFTAQALARQKGLGGHADSRAPATTGAGPTPPTVLEAFRPLTPDDPACDYAAAAAMPAKALAMIDAVAVWQPAGGPHRQGYGLATKAVDPDEWFFKAHFFQDPVCPGSLGLESLLQLLRFMAMRRWPDACARRRIHPLTATAHQWVYRGQILPSNSRITVEAAVTRAVDSPRPCLVADGRLGVDGLWIYQMKNFGVELKG